MWAAASGPAPALMPGRYLGDLLRHHTLGLA
jgi:hypothetical protein